MLIRSKTSLKFELRVAFKYITGPSNTWQGLQIHDRAFKYITEPSNTSQSLQIHHRAFKYNAGPSRFQIYIATIHSIPLAPFDRFQILVVWYKFTIIQIFSPQWTEKMTRMIRLEICQKIHMTGFLVQKFYTLKVRNLRLFLLKKKQRKCINLVAFLLKINWVRIILTISVQSHTCCV